MDEKLRILLCEDDENLGMLLREYLQAKGYSAELCPDGEAGYKAFLKNKYDLLGLLCAHANEILQRDFALKTIWIDDNYFNARSMDVYITKLRKHLKEDDSIEIINIHGKGYKLITPEVE